MPKGPSAIYYQKKKKKEKKKKQGYKKGLLKGIKIYRTNKEKQQQYSHKWS